jgi:flagellar protein FliS
MNPYLEQKILSADPIELVGLLYQRAIASTRDARGHLRDGLIAGRSKAIVQAYEVLRELLGSLRPEAAPDLATRFREIYSYMQQRLMDANLRQEDAPLVEVLGLLTTLEEAWDELGKREAAQKARSGAWKSERGAGEAGMKSGIVLEA